MRTFGYVVCGIAIFLIITVASIMGGLFNKTVNSTSIISNYEWFYDMKNQIDATKMKVKIAKQSNFSESTGTEMVLMSMIAEYNSKSKQITRNLWKAKDLPYEITMEN